MMVADLLPPMSIENIQLNLKQKMNTKGTCITGCSLLPNGRMVLSCNSTRTVSFINTEGVELFQIGREKQDPLRMIQFILKKIIALLCHLEAELIDV